MFITIPKQTQWRNIEPKQNLNSAGQTPNPVTVCLTSTALHGSAVTALLTAICFPHLGCFYFLYAAFPGRYLVAQATLASWGFKCNLSITSTASCNGFFRPPSRDFSATYLAQQLSLASGEGPTSLLLLYPWILNHVAEAIEVQLPTWDGTSLSPWNTLTLTFICPWFFSTRKSLRLFISQTARLAGWVL